MENTDHSGHFHCPNDLSTMGVREIYQSYHLNYQGQLVASYPSHEVEGEIVVHTFDKNMFCLEHLQVCKSNENKQAK